MAKKPKANSQNNTIRGIVIALSAVIIVIGALLVWNNRSVSFAGTINGERVPVAQLNVFHQNWIDQIHFEWGIPVTPDIADMAREWAWGELVDIWIISNQADSLGIILSADDLLEVDEIVDAYNAFFGREHLRAWGFTNASLRRFAERLVLQDRVRARVLEDVVINEDELAEAFENFLVEHALELQSVYIYYIEVTSAEMADQLMMQIFTGASIVELMREHSVAYNPLALPVDEDGELIERINALDTPLNPEQIGIVYAMGIGTLSDVQMLDNGNFALFQVVDVEEADRDMVFEFFHEDFTAAAQNELLENNMLIWRAQTNVVQNSRVLGE